MPEFCSGFGQYHSANHKTNPKPYPKVTHEQIISMAKNPPSVDKSTAQWIIPSTLLSREATAQREKGEYFAVWCDFDSHTELDSIKQVLTSLGCFYLVYSSRSAKPDLKKWRVIIFLATAANPTDWQIVTSIINDKFQAVGIVPDRASERHNQVAYLSNKGEFYDYFIAENLPYLNWQQTLSAEIQAKKSAIQQQQNDLKARQEQARIKAAERMATGQKTPVLAFNEAYDLENCLLNYGYTKHGKRYLSPNSQTGVAGVTLKDGKWFSSHASDSGIGKPTNGGCFGDVFDLFVYYECGGNYNDAIKKAGEMFTTANGLTLNKASQIEFMKQKNAPDYDDFPDSESENVFSELKNSETTSTTSTTSTNPELLDKLSPEYALKVIDDVLAACKDDSALLNSEEFKNALTLIRETDPDRYSLEIRPKLKESKHSGVRLSDIERITAPMTSGGGGDDSIATTLINLVKSECELYFDAHNADGKCFAVTTEDGIEKSFEIGTESFIEWLSFRYYSTTSDEGNSMSASETSLKQACFALKGIAKYEGEKQRFFLRTAPYQNGHIVFIGNDNWQVIEVLPTGWRILNQSPVRFYKPKSMQSLPIPVQGGDLNKLWDFANVTEQDRPLVLAWMLESWRQNTPFPILAITGSQGSAKSSTQDRIRQLIDPNAVNLRAAPKTTEDIYIGAGNNWLSSFENISRLTPQQQDALCTLATGGGFATRKLYANDEESIIEVKRPVIINSIPTVVTAQDLTDRLVSIELPQIAYKEDSEIREAFELAKPEILGGLLDLFVKTLAKLDSVKLNKPPRMADFTRLGEAMMQSQGYLDGEFTRLFCSNRAESVGKSLESSPIALAILELAETRHKDVFYGSPKKLLELLEPYKSENDGWVRSPRGLSDVLRRQAPALSQFGITINISKTKQRTDTGVCYPITIKKFVDVVDVVDVVSEFLSSEKKFSDAGVI